jgi:hypothetical protein
LDSDMPTPEKPSLFPFDSVAWRIEQIRKQKHDLSMLDKELQPSRRTRGYLHDDIERICRGYLAGELDGVLKGRPLTPYMPTSALVEIDSLEVEDRPSHGAVQQIFQKWEAEGTALFMRNPYAFVTFKENINPEL